MKTLRKNIDLDSDTVAILLIEGTLKGLGSLKPFLEGILKDYAKKCLQSRPGVYKSIVDKKAKKIDSKKSKLARRAK